MESTLAGIRFGDAVRRRRRSVGLSQAQTCDLAGVGLAFLYGLERGKPTVRLDKVLAVLEVLGLGLELREAREVLGVASEIDPEAPSEAAREDR